MDSGTASGNFVKSACKLEAPHSTLHLIGMCDLLAPQFTPESLS